jgi:hypothetical protein
MSFAHTIKNHGAIYFVTFTVHQWVDVFTRPLYREAPRSLEFATQEKLILKGISMYYYKFISL